MAVCPVKHVKYLCYKMPHFIICENLGADLTLIAHGQNRWKNVTINKKSYHLIIDNEINQNFPFGQKCSDNREHSNHQAITTTAYLTVSIPEADDVWISATAAADLSSTCLCVHVISVYSDKDIVCVYPCACTLAWVYGLRACSMDYCLCSRIVYICGPCMRIQFSFRVIFFHLSDISCLDLMWILSDWSRFLILILTTIYF
jgi:hypothetical protein